MDRNCTNSGKVTNLVGVSDAAAEFSERFLFDTFGSEGRAKLKYFVLVIYDISDNKRRSQLVKILKGFGFRVQKSAFEAVLSPQKYMSLLKKMAPVADVGDSIRVYKIRGEGALTIFGDQFTAEDEEVIIL